MLSACSFDLDFLSNQADNDNSVENATSTTTENNESHSSENEPSNGNDEEEPSELDAQEILAKVAEVMSEMTGMAISGTIDSTTDMMGVTEDEKSEVIGELSLNPVQQHINVNTVSSLEGNSNYEMYMSDGNFYMKGSELPQWMLIPLGEGGLFSDMIAMVTDKQLKYYEDVYEVFDMEEDSHHYTLSYTGSGGEFKEVAFAGLKYYSNGELYDTMTSIIKDVSGSYRFKIDKDTFYIVEMGMDYEQTVDMGAGEVRSIETINYTYSNFNNVDVVTVPDEVKANAQVFRIPNMQTND